MIVVVQLVELVWTKASRGAPASTTRHAVPRAFDLLVPSAPGAFVLHHVRCDERHGFTPSTGEASTADTVPLRHGELVLRVDGDGVVVGFAWQGATGQPRRPAVKAATRVGPGRTARVVVNGRHASSSGQWYRQATYNVAVVVGPSVDAGVFTARPPDDVASFEADLF